MGIYVSNSFYMSWKIVPFLLLSTMFSSFSAFLGANYVAMENTKGASKTVAIGALINVILNYLLINLIGVIGAALATAISFAGVWILRMFDTRKFVVVKIDWFRMCALFSLIIIQIFIIYFVNNSFSYFFNIICLFLILYLSKELFIGIGRRLPIHGNFTK